MLYLNWPAHRCHVYQTFHRSYASVSWHPHASNQWFSNCGARGLSGGTRAAFLSYSKSFANSFLCYNSFICYANSFMCYINLKYIWANYVHLKPGVYTPTLRKHQVLRDLKTFENYWNKLELQLSWNSFAVTVQNVGQQARNAFLKIRFTFELLSKETPKQQKYHRKSLVADLKVKRGEDSGLEICVFENFHQVNMFYYDICVFSPSINGLQCLLNICGDYAAEHEIIFNCNNTIGVIFCPKKYKQPAPSRFSKWCTCTIFKPSEISWCVDKCIIEGWWWHSETSEITILCSKQTQRHFWSVLYCSKKHFACQCMLANCGANTRRLVWSACVLHITMPIELCITYPEMWVFAHTRLAIVSGPLMPC